MSTRQTVVLGYQPYVNGEPATLPTGVTVFIAHAKHLKCKNQETIPAIYPERICTQIQYSTIPRQSASTG